MALAVLLAAGIVIAFSLGLPDLSGAGPGSDGGDIKRHDVSIAIEPAEHTVQVVDRIELETAGAGRQVFFLGAGFKIEKLILSLV